MRFELPPPTSAEGVRFGRDVRNVSMTLRHPAS